MKLLTDLERAFEARVHRDEARKMLNQALCLYAGIPVDQAAKLSFPKITALHRTLASKRDLDPFVTALAKTQCRLVTRMDLVAERKRARLALEAKP